MNILGLSFDYHDSAAALICDGEIVAASSEERFSRKKNDCSMPINAAQFCLSTSGIQADRLDCVVFYENTLLKLHRIVSTNIKSFPSTKTYLNAAVRSWAVGAKLYTKERIAEHFDLPLKAIKSVRHHDAHAASAFYCSPFESSAIVTLDGVGEYETMTICRGAQGAITKLRSTALPHSVGLLYSAFTAYLGFKVDEDEYKVMGMAGYGEPKFADQIMELFNLRDDGTFTLDQTPFDFLAPKDVLYTNKLVEMFGPPRRPETYFETSAEASALREANARQNKHYADIAASVQKATENVILHIGHRALELCSTRNLCLAGGVALNSLANGRLKRELPCNLFVQPAAGDAGCALGAALYYYHNTLGNAKRSALASPYLGRAFSDNEVRQALRRTYTSSYISFENDRDLYSQVARILNSGRIVGWFQGRAEWGPRALGNRSILADASNARMKEIVNGKIKFREQFRPFAPAVLEEYAHEYFEIGDIRGASDPEYFMLAIASVKQQMRHLIPAVTHVDGTARVQLVNKDTNPRFHALLTEFRKLTGTPLLLNTSFNLRGEPIVNSPEDAIRTFEWSDIDFLALNNVLVFKENHAL